MSDLIEAPVTEAFKVEVNRGTMSTRVSSEWFNRPADQRFLDLNSLYESTHRRYEHSTVRTTQARDMRVQATREDASKLTLLIPGNHDPIAPTNWSFGQLCSLVQAPAGYLNRLPGTLAGINLQHGLLNSRGAAEVIKTMQVEDGRVELRAATGPDYGRIFDCEVVEAVRKIAGNGTGDTRWKVPGMLNWSNGTYNPFVDITSQTTTLYASDRDVFMFLVDDTHPIQCGTLPDGSPDLYFRGFIIWNSEVGSRTLGIATFYLRGVCMNRCLWGVEGWKELIIRHSKFACDRFASEVAPRLLQLSESSTAPFEAKIAEAKSTKVATDDDARKAFLKNKGFSKSETTKIMEAVLNEEGHEAESVFDFVNGITAVARKIEYQDARLEMEQRAGKILAAV